MFKMKSNYVIFKVISIEDIGVRVGANFNLNLN
jgi:hypothetical protein